MGYNPITQNGYNMFEMASLLQKAVRRNDYDGAGFAAAEMYDRFRGVMWNRMLTISSEDCWGIVTKELVVLRDADDNALSYDDSMYYVSKAIALMCRAKKSRDACYFACNFILAENERKEIAVTPEEAELVQEELSRIPDSVFTLSALNSNSIYSFVRKSKPEFEQMSLSPKKKRHQELSSDGKDVYEVIALLHKAIRLCDMENIGYAVNVLRSYNRMVLWKGLLAFSVKHGSGDLTKEIIALKMTDDMVNGKKKPESRDEIFISKSLMLLCYEQTGAFGDLCCNEIVDPDEMVDWSLYRFKNIDRCKLKDGIIPEWVYDVHTIRGKRAGKTDWGMNIVEQAALDPLQVAFFDEGSWAPRYDYKHIHKMCSELEYQLSLEYRMDHESNPVERLPETRLDEAINPDKNNSFSEQLLAYMEGGFLDE